MKHIIIKGPDCSGKTLLSKLLFSPQFTFYICGRNFRTEDPFAFDGFDNIRHHNILIDDVPKNATADLLLNIVPTDELNINRLGREILKAPMPRFVFIVDDAFIFPDDEAFGSRFLLIQSNHTSIADIVKIIHQERIYIKTHW